MSDRVRPSGLDLDSLMKSNNKLLFDAYKKLVNVSISFTNSIIKTIIQDLLVKNKEKAEMFVTIITIILLTIAFTLWAIIYGGSKNISGTERVFDNEEEQEYIKEWNLKHEKKLNEKLLRKINRKTKRKQLIKKLRWILWH